MAKTITEMMRGEDNSQYGDKTDKSEGNNPSKEKYPNWEGPESGGHLEKEHHEVKAEHHQKKHEMHKEQAEEHKKMHQHHKKMAKKY